MVGKTVSHYRILEKIGEGGMGVVYRAEDTRLKRHVALKFLSVFLPEEAESEWRFEWEAQAAASLDHPNICPVYELGEAEGRPYIVMAYVDGVSLRKLLQDEAAVPLEAALDYAVQIARGLQAAHEAKIVHRDIKPENILISRNGRVRISDFGLAKMMNRPGITRQKTEMGTVAYISPEQIRGEEVDHRTDLWSFGVLLYEMLAGRPPFRGEYDQAVVYSILNEDPEPLETIRPELPDDLIQIVRRLLSKDPAQRFQDMRETLAELEKLRAGENYHGGKWKRKVRRLVSRPGIALAAFVGLAFFGLATGVLLFYPSETVPFTEQDWVLLADFQNATGDQIFDSSLSTALAVSIAQSKRINIFPARRVREVLQRMRKSDVTFLDETLAREVAEREGIPVIVVPSIAQIGGQYLISAVLEDPVSGEYLKVVRIRAASKDRILDALDELAGQIRHSLGETRYSVWRNASRLSKVTTASLEALKQYSLGEQYLREGKYDRARFHFGNAVQIDSTFAGAMAALGILEYEYYDPKRGREFLQRAMNYIDDLSERERFGVMAAYAIAVEKDYRKAIRIYEGFLREFPRQSVARNNLGQIYAMMGYYEKAVEEYRRAIAVEPTLLLPYRGIVWAYLYSLGQLDSAVTWSQRLLKYQPEDPWAHDNLGWAYVGLDSFRAAEKEFRRAVQIDPGFAQGLYRLVHLSRLRKDYPAALSYLKKLQKASPEDRWTIYHLGVIYQLMGDYGRAEKQFRRFLQLLEEHLQEDPEAPEIFFNMALVLARLGQKERAEAMLMKGMALDSAFYFERAAVYSVLGEKEKAIDLLEEEVEHGYGNFIWIKIHPDFQPLYEEPRFQALIRKGLHL